MQTQVQSNERHSSPPYFLDIEGKEIPWSSPTITTEEIARLGGWDVSNGVIEIDRDNNERTLAPEEVVPLKPGHGFAKKVKWKRGDNLFEQRLVSELALLHGHYDGVKMQSGWFLIPHYPTLIAGWNRSDTAVAFQAQSGHPGTPPYGIYVPVGIRFKDALPKNYQEPAGNRPPFEGEWGIFSWAPEDGHWRSVAVLTAGSNLLNYALGIAHRFREGE